VIRGGMEDWKALERWPEPGYLESVSGDHAIPVAQIERGEAASEPMPLAEFWPRVRRPPNGSYCAIVERAITVFGDRPGIVSELAGDIGAPSYLAGLAHTRSSLFAGHDTRSPCHYHPGGEVLLCQVVGRKRVFCYEPTRTHSRALYPNAWYTSSFTSSSIRFPMDGSIPDPARYPRFAEARPVECVLEPGEMLYIPIYWWHHAFCEGFAVSVGVFHKSIVRKRYMKLRGLRCNLLNYRVLRYWWRRATGTLEGHLADGGRRFARSRIPD
jgi:hypothetical protein